MKQIITLLTCLLTFGVFGQARIGFTLSDIKKDFAKYPQSLTTTDDGDYRLKVETPEMVLLYYFKEYSYATAVIPLSDAMLNAMVELYNKNYVIVSSTEWKSYTAEGVMKGELIFAEGGGYYILWTEN